MLILSYCHDKIKEVRPSGSRGAPSAAADVVVASGQSPGGTALDP